MIALALSYECQPLIRQAIPPCCRCFTNRPSRTIPPPPTCVCAQLEEPKLESLSRLEPRVGPNLAPRRYKSSQQRVKYTTVVVSSQSTTERVEPAHCSTASKSSLRPLPRAFSIHNLPRKATSCLVLERPAEVDVAKKARFSTRPVVGTSIQSKTLEAGLSAIDCPASFGGDPQDW